MIFNKANSPIDSLVAFSKLGISSASAPVRYSVRQVLDQEYHKETLRKKSDILGTTSAVGKEGVGDSGDTAQKAMKDSTVKRDFFGRVIQEPKLVDQKSEGNNTADESSKAGRKVWVTYHEGFSNAVRKPISMGELLMGL